MFRAAAPLVLGRGPRHACTVQVGWACYQPDRLPLGQLAQGRQAEITLTIEDCNE
jgi:hypothetical protein